MNPVPRRIVGLRQAVATVLDDIQREAPGAVIGAIVIGALLLEGAGPKRRAWRSVQVIQSPALHETTRAFLLNDAGRALCRASLERATHESSPGEPRRRRRREQGV